jgi:hypothetical protein
VNGELRVLEAAGKLGSKKPSERPDQTKQTVDVESGPTTNSSKEQPAANVYQEYAPVEYTTRPGGTDRGAGKIIDEAPADSLNGKASEERRLGVAIGSGDINRLGVAGDVDKIDPSIEVEPEHADLKPEEELRISEVTSAMWPLARRILESWLFRRKSPTLATNPHVSQ